MHIADCSLAKLACAGQTQSTGQSVPDCTQLQQHCLSFLYKFFQNVLCFFVVFFLFFFQLVRIFSVFFLQFLRFFGVGAIIRTLLEVCLSPVLKIFRYVIKKNLDGRVNIFLNTMRFDRKKWFCFFSKLVSLTSYIIEQVLKNILYSKTGTI